MVKENLDIRRISVGFILLITPIAIGIISSLLTIDMMNVYETIIKPPFSPPSYIFPIAWSILYALMGCGLAFTYTTPSSKNRTYALILSGIQLAFNFSWSIIFFNLRNYFLAFVWLVLLLISVIGMLHYYRKVSKLSFYLNLAYPVWLVFAGYLNLMILILN